MSVGIVVTGAIVADGPSDGVTVRVASCRCGQLRAICTGDPMRISVCHCLDCQQRSGSAFAAQARWPDDRVLLAGAFSEWSPVSNSGARAVFRFCPTCGGTVAFTTGSMPGTIAVPLGTFADPTFPSPTVSVYEERRHRWVSVTGNEVEHIW